MPNSNIAPASPSEEVGFFAQLIPNCGVARFYRSVVRIFIAVFALAGVSLLWDVYADLRARHAWPVADGEIVSVSQQDSKGVPGSTTTDKHTRYWVEYEVRFAVPADQCKTGTIYGSEQDPMPCLGIVRTRSTSSPQTVYEWLTHAYPRNAHVQILHDPNGPGAKIAGESVWLVYRWDKIFPLIGILAFLFIVRAIVQRRIEYLENLPENYSAAPTSSSPQYGRDDLTDLKLP